MKLAFFILFLATATFGQGTLHFVRNVNVGKAIGTTKVGHGGGPTPWLRVLTDTQGNLLTTFIVPGPRSTWNPGIYGFSENDEDDESEESQ